MKRVHGSVGRQCSTCKREGTRSAMRPNRRHVHELDVGTTFRFNRGGPIWKVEQRGLTHCKISLVAAQAAAKVAFVTEAGESIQFKRKRPRAQPCAPHAEVIPERQY